MTGAIAWFTGLPASGKSTLAARVREALSSGVVVLDSDELRDVLGAHGYDDTDRERFYAALARLAVVLARQGLVVLVAATAPRRAHRDVARASGVPFVEVWVRTPLEECERRDPKGLYAAARRGDAPRLPGSGAVYEPPCDPEVIADGARGDPAAVVAALRTAIARST